MTCVVDPTESVAEAKGKEKSLKICNQVLVDKRKKINDETSIFDVA